MTLQLFPEYFPINSNKHDAHTNRKIKYPAQCKWKKKMSGNFLLSILLLILYCRCLTQNVYMYGNNHGAQNGECFEQNVFRCGIEMLS